MKMAVIQNRNRKFNQQRSVVIAGRKIIQSDPYAGSGPFAVFRQSRRPHRYADQFACAREYPLARPRALHGLVDENERKKKQYSAIIEYSSQGSCVSWIFRIQVAVAQTEK